MADELDPLLEILQAWALRQTPAKRRELARGESQELRKSNSTRQSRNMQPDGTNMTPRKKRADGKLRSRKKMFARLRMVRLLKSRSNSEGFEVGYFAPRAAKVAEVHHYGLEDKVDDAGRIRIKYPARILLGFARDDEERIMNRLAAMFD